MGNDLPQIAFNLKQMKLGPYIKDTMVYLENMIT